MRRNSKNVKSISYIIIDIHPEFCSRETPAFTVQKVSEPIYSAYYPLKIFGSGEIEKLLLHCAGELAKDRKNRGIKLNFVESTALISSELLELAREGKSVPDLMNLAAKILTKDDVMEGVAEVLHEVQIEATFPDGTKLVTVHNPIL